MIKKLSLTVKTLFLLILSVTTFAQTSLKGKITDNDGSPLIGASVVIMGTTTGTITDVNGDFKLDTGYKLPLKVLASYTGFETKTIEVTNAEGLISIKLGENNNSLDEVVISASRRAEKIQDAPAAISVINSKKIEMDNVANPMFSLRNMTGVDISQTGVADGQINLRGRGAVFNTETFIIADYRNVVIPSLGTAIYGQMPIDALDLDRIEVVKGPGGALYGPGVEAGVVHFISKSPFKQQGTSISVAAGNQSQQQYAFRTAKVVANGKLGLKLTGFYRSALDFSQGNATMDARLAAYKPYVVSSVNTADTLRRGAGLDYDNKAMGLTGSAEYKINGHSSIVGLGGFGRAAALFKTGQGDGYQDVYRPFAQIRYSNKGFFAQLFWSKQLGNDGTSWLYTSASTNINLISQLEGQVQYEFNTAKDKLNLIVGGDFRNNSIDTKGSINGRFENSDKYQTEGAYVQGKYALSKKLDLVAAGRVDRFEALNATALSPRVGLVYKPTENHSFRLTYNHAIGAPSALQLYNDFANTKTANFNIWLNGGAQALTFNDNKYFTFLPAAIGGGASTTSDLSLLVAYRAATAGLVGKLPKEATDYLASAAMTSKITGTTPATLITTAGVPTTLVSRQEIGLSTSNMIEFGYQGKLTDKLNVTVDIYHNSRDNNLTPAMYAGAMLGYAKAGDDLATAVAASIPAAVATQFGLSPAAIGAIYKKAIETNTLTAAGGLKPLGVISADQTTGTKPTLDLTYFNVEKIQYWGSDLGVNYSIIKGLTAFANYSWLSKTYWSKVNVKNSTSSVPFSLNQPGNRLRVGLDYIREKGILFNFAVRNNSAWTSTNGGAYTGDVPANTVVDAGIGYAVNRHIRFNATGTNIFDKKIVMIPNAPYIRRLVLVKATVNF